MIDSSKIRTALTHTQPGAGDADTNECTPQINRALKTPGGLVLIRVQNEYQETDSIQIRFNAKANRIKMKSEKKDAEKSLTR